MAGTEAHPGVSCEDDLVGFVVTHLVGNMERGPSLEVLSHLIAELDIADADHAEVSVKDEQDWCLSAFPSGLVVFENLAHGDPRHMSNIAKGDILRLWRALATGNLAELERQPWLPGYG